MNPAAEVLLIAQREVRKNVRSAKGIVLLALSLLGGVVVALVLAWIEKMKREQLAGLPPEAAQEIQRRIILQLGDGDEALGDALVKAPGALLGALKVTIRFGPALVALLGFDAVSGELQHRTVRYWTVRTRRVSFYVGKVLGLWAVVSVLTLLVHAFIWAIVIARGETAGAVIEWGPRLWAVTLPISLVWCGIAQLVASQFRAPILSLLVTFGSFFVLWIGYVAGASGKAPPLLYLYPNIYDTWLLHPHPDRLFEGLGICLLSAAIYVAAGAAAFTRRERMSDARKTSEAADGLLPRDPRKPVAKASNGSAPADSKRSPEPAARLIQVTKTFGATIAVNELSLRIPAGCVYGLIGPNGAGKTTTFSMLAGYLAPTRGEIRVLGHVPTDADALRGRVGVLPQDALLPSSDKVGEFLVYAARLQNVPANKAEQLARDVLAEVDGRDWWSTRCGALSHGMAKRVALAQALIGEPEVVLLDEPTAGLDPRVAYEVRQIVSSRKGRCTLIVSSHNLQELEQICDAAAILDRGRVVAEGTMAELTAASEEVRIKLAPGPVPLAPVRELPMVTRAEFDDDRRELVVHFERKTADAETVIGATLGVLLQQGARISGVSKGRGLEKRVMEMTAGEDS